MIRLLIVSLLCFDLVSGFAQNRPLTEDDFYRIVTLPVPEGIQLEVGGLAVLPDGRLGVSTRRGDIWLISNPYMKNGTSPTYKRFAKGLHEPLGLAYINNHLMCTQRGEFTVFEDNDHDDVADEYKAFAKWPLSGNYHEYSYGPVLLPSGEMIITLNLGWIGHGASLAKWRGWMLKFSADGKTMTPWATGLRSPAGFGVFKNGDILYTENQGDWVGSGRMTHLQLGDFAGNPAGLRWTNEPGSPLQLKPTDIPDTNEPLYEVAKRVPHLKIPAVWFPHTLMGISTSDVIEDNTEGQFGPFEGQLFVGDQGHSKIMRVFLEKVKGEYQGICFPFREGFQSGILRLRWGIDGSIFVGMTNRGWASTGKDPFGVQRLAWTGKVPFEIKAMRSTPEGFEVEFTQAIDKTAAANAENYQFSSFTYQYHHQYGSPIINTKTLKIKALQVSEDGLKVRVALDELRLGYIHQIKIEGLTNVSGQPLLHNVGYYTLNAINESVPAMDVAKYAVTEKREEHHHTMPMNSTTTIETISSSKRPLEMPSEWNGTIDQTIKIGTKPGLKFDTKLVEVKAGSKIKLTFSNNDDMLHNLLIVKPNTVDQVGKMANNMGLEGANQNYVPNSPNVLFHTGLMQPETTESIYFIAPSTPGDYTFVCTFPGHYTLMQGIIRVKK